MKSNRVLKGMKAAHRDEKLAVVIWSDAARGQQQRLVINSRFLFKSHDSANLARRKTRCDADSSPLYWLSSLVL